jgi:hypothetical protein
MYGLPNGWQARSTDTSDILVKGGKRRRKRQDEELEEQIAAYLLRSQQPEIEIPERANINKVRAILRSKLENANSLDAERIKKIRYLLMALALDD